MSIQDENKKDAKSKIEQIRIDLEKKLSAIENNKNDISNKIDNKIEIINETDPVFEITEPIIPVKIEKDVVEKNTVEKDVVNENITIEQEKPKTSEKALKSKVAPIVKINESIEQSKTIISSSSNKEKENIINDKTQEEKIIEEEKKSKKGILSFVLYGLLIALFLAIGYMVVDYMKQNDELANEKMEQKLSEFKNKRYLDSVELAELNNQLEDLQTKKMLDSLDRLNELLLLSKIDNSNNKNSNNIIKNSTTNKSYKRHYVTATNSNNVNKNKLKINQELEKVKSQGIENTKPKISVSKDDVVQQNDNNLIEKANDKVEESLDKENDINGKEDFNKSKVIEKDLTSPVVKVKKVPIYPGCEKKKTELDRKKCLSSKMYKHILRKFNSEVANNSGLEDGIHEVRVSYIIDKAGYATVLSVRGENKELEDEAIRVIQSLPKMIPGTTNGKKSKTLYNIPIKFNISN